MTVRKRSAQSLACQGEKKYLRFKDGIVVVRMNTEPVGKREIFMGKDPKDFQVAFTIKGLTFPLQ